MCKEMPRDDVEEFLEALAAVCRGAMRVNDETLHRHRSERDPKRLQEPHQPFSTHSHVAAGLLSGEHCGVTDSCSTDEDRAVGEARLQDDAESSYGCNFLPLSSKLLALRRALADGASYPSAVKTALEIH